MRPVPTAETCSRCNGKGRLKAFGHVKGGICFRCWGTLTDPKALQDLELWILDARKEYKLLRASGQDTTDLVRRGKAAASRLAWLRAMLQANHDKFGGDL